MIEKIAITSVTNLQYIPPKKRNKYNKVGVASLYKIQAKPLGLILEEPQKRKRKGKREKDGISTF